MPHSPLLRSLRRRASILTLAALVLVGASAASCASTGHTNDLSGFGIGLVDAGSGDSALMLGIPFPQSDTALSLPSGQAGAPSRRSRVPCPT
jgi:hypothetical protein